MNKIASSSLTSLLLAGLGASAPVGCIEGGEYAEYTCAEPMHGHLAADGLPDPCCERSVCPGREPTKANTCAGDCVPLPKGNYKKDPFLLWLADSPDKLPACESLPQGHTVVRKGAFDPDPSYTCEACTCGAPKCNLPAQLTAHALTCSGDGQGAVDTPFPAVSGWDGQCVAPTSVPPENSRSISIDPLTVGACAPSKPISYMPPPVRWGTYVRGCNADFPNYCPDEQKCMPSARGAPPGALQCVEYSDPGDTDCSDLPDYPKRYRIHPLSESMPDEAIDTRGCSPCTCDLPQGSNCSALVSTFANATCSGAPFGANMVSSDPSAQCVDVAPTMSLQSMSATLITNEPGACKPSGGKPIGSYKSTHDITFCCHDPQPDPPR